MKRNTDHILTTHVGSLVRPPAIREIMEAREYGQKADEAAVQKVLKTEVANVVKKQADIGIDIPNDGEYGKAGWVRYVSQRLGGFIQRERRPGDRDFNPAHVNREVLDYPEFYAAYQPIVYYDWLPPGQSKTPLKQAGSGIPLDVQLVWECVAPIKYNGHAAIKQDIDNLKAALAGVKVEEAFMPVAAPLSARGIWYNAYYKTEEEILVALAEALREEYKAIVDAGFILQIDDAFFAHEWYRLLGEMSEADVRKKADSWVELTNHALKGIPEDRVRYHLCWGSWNAPHTSDIPLSTLADYLLRINAQGYSIEGANPRHEHEWMYWKTRKFPDGKILVPGIVTHSTNVVEHPELVAWRIKNFASVVGRENVIASTDCGFAQSYNVVRCHSSVMWAKLQSLAEGAKLASKELWGR